jgi:hypothetical protein
MSEELDVAAEEFAREVAPVSRPRDQTGKFVQTRERPEPMFGLRPIEGDAITGDTRDAGDNPSLRSAERQVTERDVADGRAPRRPEPEDDDVEETSDAVENLSSDERRAVVPEEDEPEPDSGQKYEVTIDGRPHEVSLEEALAGCVRQETFHRRVAELNSMKMALDEDAVRQQSNWNLLAQARADYEEDLTNLTPTEPDWDREFSVNPAGAHYQQKIFQTIYGQLDASRRKRELMLAHNRQESDRRLEKYAVDGFSVFVANSKIKDEPELRKELASMRKTALAEGFSEYEVATIYDPRMLRVLRKASKYDRMMAAARPKAVVPGHGRTLTPGAATPLSGNGRRNGLDDAQRRLASSGRMDDATEVFRRML